MRFYVVGVRFSLIPDNPTYREFFERLDTGFVQVTRLVGMPLLFVRRFTDIEGGAFPRPVLDKIILLPVVEDVGEFEFQRLAVYPGFCW